jgi:UDP-3-O-acyl-N-acetylglucosamine deacetylase
MIFSDPVFSTSQCTFSQAIHYVGIGLHGGRSVSMQLHPTVPNTGICFVRKDVPASDKGGICGDGTD